MFGNLNHAKEIIAVVSAILGVLVSGIPLFLTLIIKTKSLLDQKNWNKLTSELPKFIIEAEQFLNYSGLEKKEYVKTKLAIYALSNKIRFCEEMFDNRIDEIVSLTKKVNARDKDKQRAAAPNQIQRDGGFTPHANN